MTEDFAFCIRPLTPDDVRKDFCCGDIELDRFFQRYAGQNQFRHHIGTSYIAVARERIAGYATVSVGELAAEHRPAALGPRLPSYPLPVLRLARLAVDRRY